MANYIFDTMSQTDATNFTTADTLFFLSGGVANLGVSDSPYTTTSTALGTTTTFEAITLTEDGKSLTFGAVALAYASQHNHVIFPNSEVAVFGASTDNSGVTSNDTLSLSGGIAGHAAVAFGFDGADSITGGAGNDTINGGAGNDVIIGSSTATETDFLLGGAGADSITGSAGNDHIYGNVAVGAAGTTDGNDTINAGTGHDYVNGNAGDDSINGEDGNDRLYGGAGNDTVEGGNGNDYLQGNLGNDTLSDTGVGAADNDTIHGGQGNDIISDAHGSNQLWGDLGNDSVTGGDGNDWIGGGDGTDTLVGGAGDDTIVGGTGYDLLTGGTGNDTFVFATGDAGVANLDSATTAASHGLVDEVTDFANGNDHFSLGFSVSAVDSSATTFASVDDAYTYAKGILAGHGSDVAALQVGTGTYVFWDSTHTTGTIDSAVHVDSVAASLIDKTDFI